QHAAGSHPYNPTTGGFRFYPVGWIIAVMPDYRTIEEKISKMLASDRRPVAIAFLDAPPKGVTRFEGSEPSSCSFWRIAASGRTFYTVPSNHFNCPIGGDTPNALTAGC